MSRASATEEAILASNGCSAEVFADAQGRFRFENVPPGTYWIRSYVQWFVSNRMPIQGGVLVDLVYVKPNQSIVDVILTR